MKSLYILLMTVAILPITIQSRECNPPSYLSKKECEEVFSECKLNTFDGCWEEKSSLENQ